MRHRLFTVTGEVFDILDADWRVQKLLTNSSKHPPMTPKFASPVETTATAQGRYLHLRRGPHGLIRVILPSQICKVQEA